MAILNKSEFTFFYGTKKWIGTLFCIQEVCIGVDLMCVITGLFYHPLAGSGSWQISLSFQWL